FFQAEDGIRDFHVTGVLTCALPILSDRWRPPSPPWGEGLRAPISRLTHGVIPAQAGIQAASTVHGHWIPACAGMTAVVQWTRVPDRKSTRQNSSHVKVSYAVFCLKR